MNPTPETLARVAKLIGCATIVETSLDGLWSIRWGGQKMMINAHLLTSDDMAGRVLDALAERFRNVELYYSKANGGWHVELMDFDNSTDISGPTRPARLTALLAVIGVLPEDVL